MTVINNRNVNGMLQLKLREPLKNKSADKTTSIMLRIRKCAIKHEP